MQTPSIASPAKTTSRLRIVVLGYIVRGPLGGFAWHHMQYVMGLAELGHDVYFLEDSSDSPWCCYDPSRQVTDRDPSFGLNFAGDAFSRVGLGDRWAYYDAHTVQWLGPCANRAFEICATADLLINVSEEKPERPWLMAIPNRVFVDTDPAFTQIRSLTDPVERQRALQYTAFCSFAENIGQVDCSIPDDGLPWQATRQPVVFSAWPVLQGPRSGKFTTIMQWESYPALEYHGRRFGMKAESFMPDYLDLPEKAGPCFELALGSPSAPRALLSDKGWSLRDPLVITQDPWTYQAYIQQSKAEFSVAKHGYVVCHSGWFSERSAVYLASGRPVIVQDTGFTKWLPTGAGVLAFNTPEEALSAVDEVNRRYEFHCQAARQVADEYFNADKVLEILVENGMR